MCSVNDVRDAKGRMKEVVRWFLSSISASRKVNMCVCVRYCLATKTIVCTCSCSMGGINYGSSLYTGL